MTRKRFIKLLMSEGYSRNQANALARSTKYPYGNYKIYTVKKRSTSSIALPRRKYKYTVI